MRNRLPRAVVGAQEVDVAGPSTPSDRFRHRALSAPAPRPAFATRMSRHALPSRPTSNRRRTSSGSVTSAVTARAPPPCAIVGHAVHLAGRARRADDERPFPGIGKRNPLADPAARAGHEGDLSLQPHRGRGVPGRAVRLRRSADWAASLDRCRNAADAPSTAATEAGVRRAPSRDRRVLPRAAIRTWPASRTPAALDAPGIRHA